MRNLIFRSMVLIAALPLIAAGCGGGGGSSPAEPAAGVNIDSGLSLAAFTGAGATGVFAQPVAINNGLQVVGAAEYEAGGHLQAALWMVDEAGTATIAPTSLATLVDGGFAAAFDINEAGVIVGMAMDAQGLTRALFWPAAGEQPIVLPGRGGPYAAAFAINGSGRIVGLAETSEERLEAVWWQLQENGTVTGPHQFTALAAGWEAAAFAVNDDGTVAGELISPAGISQAVLWRLDDNDAYSRLDLPSAGSTHTVALGLNNPGAGEPLVVVGETAFDGENGARRAVRWLVSDTVNTLVLANLDSSAEAVNSSGRIAGWRGADARATIWTDGVAQEILTTESQAFDLNDLDLVIGRDGSQGFVKRAE